MGKGADQVGCLGMGGLLAPEPTEEEQYWLSGWAETHDYDPTWDYQVRFDLRHHKLSQMAQAAADSMTKEHQLPWNQARVYPADLEGALAIYVNGTNGAPVVIVDLQAHSHHIQQMGLGDRELGVAVVDSVLHELRHAYQEAHGWPPDEDEAEHGSERIPF